VVNVSASALSLMFYFGYSQVLPLLGWRNQFCRRHQRE